MKIKMVKQRFDSDALKEKLSSRFFLSLIKTKQNKKTKQNNLSLWETCCQAIIGSALYRYWPSAA